MLPFPLIAFKLQAYLVRVIFPLHFPDFVTSVFWLLLRNVPFPNYPCPNQCRIIQILIRILRYDRKLKSGSLCALNSVHSDDIWLQKDYVYS